MQGDQLCSLCYDIQCICSMAARCARSKTFSIKISFFEHAHLAPLLVITYVIVICADCILMRKSTRATKNSQHAAEEAERKKEDLITRGFIDEEGNDKTAGKCFYANNNLLLII